MPGFILLADAIRVTRLPTAAAVDVRAAVATVIANLLAGADGDLDRWEHRLRECSEADAYWAAR